MATQIGDPLIVSGRLRSVTVWLLLLAASALLLVLVLWLIFQSSWGIFLVRLWWMLTSAGIIGVLALLAVPFGGLLMFVVWATSTQAKWASDVQVSIANERAEKLTKSAYTPRN